MDISTTKMASTIHAVSTHLGLKIDSENYISSCLMNPTDFPRQKMVDALKILLVKVKCSVTSEHKIFWKTITNIIKKAIFMMESKVDIKIEQPSVPRILTKSDSSKDVRCVLRTTNLQCPIPFWFAAPELFDDSVLKLAEGSFGEVYRITKEGEERILKIIPVGDVMANGDYSEQFTFKEMTAEIYVSQELSNLSKDKEYRCSTYPTIYQVSVVQDTFPKAATKAWKMYNNRIQTSDHPCPNRYSSDQAYITIETEDVGVDLDSFKIEKYSIAWSIFQQVATGIAVAEEKLQFEHRDLHPGNILIKAHSEDSISVKLKSKNYLIKTNGVKASIIDFTYSRITTDEGTRYLELDDIYNPNPNSCLKFLDHRYVYVKMADLNEKNWKRFCPKTNILWLKHILECILFKMQTQRTRPIGRLQKIAKTCLHIHNRTILSYNSAFEFVMEEVL